MNQGDCWESGIHDRSQLVHFEFFDDVRGCDDPHHSGSGETTDGNSAGRRGGVFVQDKSVGLKISVHVIASNSAPMHRQ